jgi:hypothetical protein
VVARAGELGGAFDPTSDFLNGHPFLAAEFPSENMVTDARSLARMYAATVSEVDGVRLLDPATVERMTVVQTDRTRMHGLPPGVELPADRSFSGSGGSIAFADPDAGVGFGYVPNLWSWDTAEPRARNLAATVTACLG